MKVITWNINSYSRRANLLENLINYYTPEVICLQETRTQKPIEIEDYCCYNYYAKNRRGVSILFSEECLKIDKPKIIEHSGILRKETTRAMHIVWKKTHFINVYVPQGAPSTEERKKLMSIFGPGKTDHTNYMKSVQYVYKNMFLNKIKKIAEFYHFRGEKVILCGDFNFLNTRDLIKGVKEKAILGKVKKYAEGIYRMYGSSIKIYENFLYNSHLTEWYNDLCNNFVDRGSLINYVETYVSYIDYFRVRIDYFFTNFYSPGMSYHVLLNFSELEGRSDHIPLLLDCNIIND